MSAEPYQQFSPPTPPPGWYPDSVGSLEQWWDGYRWSGQIRPVKGARKPVRGWAIALVITAGVIGLVICVVTPVSLISGMGTVYFGALIAVAVGVAAWFLPVKLWTKILAVVIAVVCIVCAVTDQAAIEHRRQQLQQDLNGSAIQDQTVPTSTA